MINGGMNVDGKVNLTSCYKQGCHRWKGLGTSMGTVCAPCSETINTWWYATHSQYYIRSNADESSCVVTDAKDVDLSEHSHIYPNPSSGAFNFYDLEATEIEVYTGMGRKVETLYQKQSELQFGETYANGIYWLKVFHGDIINTYKIVKQ